VVIDNDVSCITTYEKLFGWGSSYMRIFLRSFWASVGLGLVLNGVVYRGATGGAGEFGHMVAVPGAGAASAATRLPGGVYLLSRHHCQLS